MERFSLNIENTIEHFGERGALLQGIIAFQYPVYCIHSTIKDSTPQKEYQIDQTILKLIEALPEVEAESIQKLTNIPKLTISERINLLSKEGFLNGEHIKPKITEQGRNYLIHGNAVRFQYRSYDFFVDGRTLKPMKKGFYNRWRRYLINEKQFHTKIKNGEIQEIKDYSPDLVFTPLVKQDIISNILSKEKDKREEYAIPFGCETIEKINYSQLSYPFMIGLFISHNGEVKKELINGYASPENKDDIDEQTMGLKEVIANSIILIERNTDTNVVYSQHNMSFLKSVPNSENKIFSFSKTDIIDFIKSRTQISINSDSSLLSSEKTIIFHIDKNIIEQNKGISRKLIQNFIRGRDYILSPYTLNGVWLICIQYTSTDQYVKMLVQLYKELESARENGEIDEFAKSCMSENTSVEMLIQLQEYDIVEKIHIAKHMTLFI